MHEYLHKYFENSKKTFKIIRDTRPLSIRDAPSNRGVRGSFHWLCWNVFLENKNIRRTFWLLARWICQCCCSNRKTISVAARRNLYGAQHISRNWSLPAEKLRQLGWRIYENGRGIAARRRRQFADDAVLSRRQYADMPGSIFIRDARCQELERLRRFVSNGTLQIISTTRFSPYNVNSPDWLPRLMGPFFVATLLIGFSSRF